MNSFNTHPLDNSTSNDNIYVICNHITSQLKDLKEYDVLYFEKYCNNFRKLQNLFYNNEVFLNESFEIFRTDSIIRYVFKNEKLTPEVVNFIVQVWDSYAALLKSKLFLLDINSSFSSIDYDKKYSQYLDEIFKHEEYFYTNIYQEEFEDEEFLRHVGNILFE